MQKIFLDADPDATLVAPRFDEAEAQTARPVVPLRRAPAWQSRRLPVALVLVSALLGGLVSVVAYRLYLRPAQTQTAAQEAQTVAAQTTATPAPKASQSPELTASAPTTDETARTAAPARKVDESTPAAKDEDGTTRDEADARRRDERAARETAAAERKDSQRVIREEPPRARRVEVIPAYPDGDRVGHDRRRDNDEASDYQLPPDQRGRHGRRVKGRNIDRIRDIFGAPPPG